MVVPEMELQGIVILVVLLLPQIVPSLAYVALFMIVPAVRIQLIVAVKSLFAESTPRVTLETALIHSSRIIVAILLVIAKLCHCKELMLMCENFLISCTQITHNSAMHNLDMSVKVRPSPGGNITTTVGAIKPKQQ